MRAPTARNVGAPRTATRSACRTPVLRPAARYTALPPFDRGAGARMPFILTILSLCIAAAPPAADTNPLATFPAAARDAHAAFESRLRAIPTSDSLQRFHELLCSEPHIAGTDGDLRTADRIADQFRSMGLEVE